MGNNSVKSILEKDKNHIKNLMVLAMADGKMTFEEEHTLSSLAHRLGLSNADLEFIKSNPRSIEFKIPDSYGEKLEQIYDLVSQISVDGPVEDKEVELCRSLALRFNLAPRVIDDLLDKFFDKDE